MFRRISILAPLFLAVLTAGAALGPISAAEPAASQPATSPDLNEALKLLSSNDTKTSDDALAKLQAAMVQQSRQVILAQQMMLRVQESLARELRALTGSSDIQAQARIAGLLEFNAAVYRWAIEVAALPEDQRDALYAWGLKDENLPLVSKVYGRNSEARIDAMQQLAKQEPGSATDWMLQLLLNDKDREISLLTLDAIFDRKPSIAMMDAVCEKAFGWQLAQYHPRQQQQHTVTVHGRTITFIENQNQNNYASQDADIAVDLLLKYKDPHVAEKFDNFFWELLVATSGANVNDNRILSLISPNYGASASIGRLIDAYKPKNALLICEKVLESGSSNANDQNINVDGASEKYRSSSRIDAAALLIRITGQEPAAYGITKMPNYNNRWLLKGSAADENELLKKLHAWLTEHGKDVGLDTVGTFPEVPVPTATPRAGRGTTLPAQQP